MEYCVPRQVKVSQVVISVVEHGIMVRSRVVTESQPAALVDVNVGVSVLAVYSVPCQTKLLQTVLSSMPVLL